MSVVIELNNVLDVLIDASWCRCAWLLVFCMLLGVIGVVLMLFVFLYVFMFLFGLTLYDFVL